MDWKKFGDTTARFIRAARALGNNAMAKVEEKVIDPATEIGMALEKITAGQADIVRQAIELAANSIQLQNKQKQLLGDINTTNQRIATLLRAGNREQALTLAGVLQKQQAELRAVSNRLLQATDEAKDIAIARDAALFELEQRRQQQLDLQAKQPAIAAMEGITAVLQGAQALSPDGGAAMAHIDLLATMTETDVCAGLDETVAEADADAIIRRLEAEETLNADLHAIANATEARRCLAKLSPDRVIERKSLEAIAEKFEKQVADGKSEQAEPPVVKTLGRETRKGVTLVEIMTIIAIVCILAVIVFGAVGGGKSNSGGGCVGADNTEAINAKEAMGFTDVTVTSTGSGFGECGGEVLSYVYHVAATNPAGQRVTNAIVCSEPFKGATVRFNKK